VQESPNQDYQAPTPFKDNNNYGGGVAYGAQKGTMAALASKQTTQ